MSGLQRSNMATSRGASSGVDGRTTWPVASSRSVRHGHQLAWRSLTSCVVSGLPPMLHSPLRTSSIVTQVTGRMRLALDLDHGVGELGDHLLLLVGVEHALDELDLHVRHGSLLAGVGSGASGLHRACARALASLRRRVQRAGPAPCKERGQTADVDFRVLGSVGIVDGAALLPLGGGMPRRLLAVLLAYRNSVVSTDRLVEVLWEEPPDSAAGTLQSYVSRLRRFVELDDAGAALVNRAPGYVLEVPGAAVDAGRFEAGLAEGQALLDRDPGRRARRASTRALGEWRGDAFAEFAETEWIRPEAVRLEELRLVATEAQVDAELRVGRHQEVVGQLEALLLDHPLRETFARQSMLALYRSGRQAEALRVAQQFRVAAARRARARPVGRAARARDRDPRGARRARVGGAAAAPAASPHRRPTPGGRRVTRIPTETTALVGRERDLELAGRLLETGRILTLFGPGGVGKTAPRPHRLAAPSPRSSPTACAWSSSARCATSAVTAAFAAALDVQQRPNRSLDDSIVELLAPQSLLLVLDNCEHVLDTTSELVEQVLRWCPDVQVLATSREPLGIPAEVVWSVPPLPVPASATSRSPRSRRPRGAAVRRAGPLGARRLRPRRRQPRRGRRDLHPARRRAAGGAGRRAHAVDEPGRSSPNGCPSGSACSPGRGAPPTPGTARCATWCSGRTTCSPRSSSCCSTGCRCSPAGSSSNGPSGSAPATASTPRRPVLLGVLVDKSMLIAGRPVPPARDAARVRARAAGASPDADAVRATHSRCTPSSRAPARGLGGRDEAQWMPSSTRASTTSARRTLPRSPRATSTARCGS